MFEVSSAWKLWKVYFDSNGPANAILLKQGQSPSLSDRFNPQFDLDVWNATLKPVGPGSTIARSGDTREYPSWQTSPPAFQANLTSAEYPSQNSLHSPHLANGSSLAEAKSHHRQTSIVHGIQHSRNGSFASSSNSPLSPQIIAAAGVERSDAFNMGDSSFAPILSGMNSGTSFSSNATLIPERPPPPGSETSSSTQKRVERMHSGKNSRDYRHHRSQSRHHKEELKTVGEYALHVLFTSVSAISAHEYCLSNASIVYSPS